MGEEDKKGCRSNIADTMEISIAEASSMFPGFRFSPTDEELICFYLRQKTEGLDNCVEVIPEVDICRYEPWDLPAKSIIQSDNEWFFFSPRGRKYPNGSQSKRATNCGYWKATGKERNVKSGSSVIGTKRTLVFHTGRAPKGQRTEWIMHEYCMTGKSQDLMVVCRVRRNSDFNLDDTSRKKSHMNKNATASSAIEQNDLCNDINTLDSYSKESSSYNSHSVEQMGPEFELEDKMTNELFQDHHASSSHQKDNSGNEEDCFADIMKDEIVKLDDSSDYFSSQKYPMVEPERESNKKCQMPVSVISSPDVPLQGTANRRLRLRKIRLKPFDTYNVMPINSPRSSQTCVSSPSKIRGFRRLVQLSVFVSLIILASVILLVHFGDFLFPSSVML